MANRNQRGILRGSSSRAVSLVIVLAACDPEPPDYASPLAQSNSSGNSSNATDERDTLQESGGAAQWQAGGASHSPASGAQVGGSDRGIGGTASARQSALSDVIEPSAGRSGATARTGASSNGPGGGATGTNGATDVDATASGHAIAGTSGSRPPGTAASCTGKSGLRSGKSNQSVSSAGITRTYAQYVPVLGDPNKAAPVVIVPHGWTMTGDQMYAITGHDRLADREGFIVLYPDGEPLSLGPWNVGDGACPSTLLLLPTATGDDQAFLDAMLDALETGQCLDRKHVFMTGFSMGGYFSNETGCLRKEIAAVGPHSGGSHDLSNCPSRRKPVILFHGAADGLIPVACGKEARDRWVILNGCRQDIESRPVKKGHCEYSLGCPTGGQVALCLFDGMDHGWAGGANASFSFPEYESAAELGWSFFTTYAW